MEVVKHFRREKNAYELEYFPIEYKRDFLKFLYKEAKNVILDEFKNRLKNKNWKFMVEIQTTFHKIEQEVKSGNDMQDAIAPFQKVDIQPAIDAGLNIIELQPWFISQTKSSLQDRYNLRKTLNECFTEIIRSFETWTYRGSGYYFVRVEKLHLNVTRFIPLSGGGCRRQDTLPTYLLAKQSITKVITDDVNSSDSCFLDCVRAGCCIQRRRIANKSYSPSIFYFNKEKIDTLDSRNLTFPTAIGQIELFEKRNDFLLINVYGLNSKVRTDRKLASLYVLHHSKQSEKEKIIIDLLYYQEHFYLIKNLSRLISRGRTSYVCRSCLTIHNTEASLKRHKQYCDNSGRVFMMPSENRSWVKFTKLESQVMKPFAIYFDIETAIQRRTPPKRKNNSARKILYMHKPIAISAIRICTSNSIYNSELFMSLGFNCIEIFFDWLEEQSIEIEMIINTANHPLKMTDADWNHYFQQTECGLCGITFGEAGAKYRDHDHLNSKYRNALCNGCNLGRAGLRTRDIPVFAHNAGRFDSKFLIRTMAIRNRKYSHRFRVIQKNKETNLVIFFAEYVFLDSCNWLSSKLSDLIDLRLLDEKKDDCKRVFPLIYKFVGEETEKYNFLTRKQVFPYSSLKGEESLKLNSLPPKNAFYNTLSKQHITDEDFDHAHNVWAKFECKNMGDYLKIYLAIDVLSLAQLFEDYRVMEFRQFAVDPSYFFSLPHFSWNTMLKYTGVKFQLIRDVEIYNFFRMSIRGGLTFITTRYAKANLPDMHDFSPENPRLEITYFDARGLYSHCLRRPLPHSDFKWLTSEEIKKFSLEDICKIEGEGFVLEVDVSFPKELHDYFRDYPPLAEHITCKPDQWTEHQKNLAATSGQGIKNISMTKKLISHLGERKNYVVHAQHLLTCKKLGVKIEKIHRILTFKQSSWVRSYIDVIAEKRKNARSVFESNNLKLQANSIYGYLLQDTSKRQNNRFVTKNSEMLKLSRKPTFKYVDIYSKHLASVSVRPQNITAMSAIAAGFCVLEYSKRHMLMFWYNFLKRVYPNDGDIKLLMTDTDSFIVATRNQEEVIKMMNRHSRYFDMSECPKPYHSTTNAKRTGTFKDELGGNQQILAFYGLRAKSYCLKFKNYDQKKQKGLPQCVVRDIGSINYHKALFNTHKESIIKHKYQSLRSLKQQLYTVSEEKRGLSCFDDKRIILNNNIDTVPYFYQGANVAKIFLR